jgi:hypothetical protein
MKRPLPFHSYAVWPPLGWVAVFGLAYAMLDGGLWIIEHGISRSAVLPTWAYIRPAISGADGNANASPREGTRPTGEGPDVCRQRALTRRFWV